MRHYLAIDIGASSGRHIVGWREDGEIKTKEVYRFPNGMTGRDRHLIWDMEALLSHVKTGIDAALEKFPNLESLSIDTWGCDYVLLQEDAEVWPCYAYRDRRTEAVISSVHKKVPFEELYRRTGCQFQSFNTIYQLYADKLPGRLEGVTDFLMIPEYLMWKLTGVKVKEYTNATTTGLVNADTGEFDRKLLELLGLSLSLFPQLCKPGKTLGEYKGIKVLLCATHNTASAVEGIPMEGNQPYISSGTWSLLGVKTSRPITDENSRSGNWSNEGGVGYNRYQKNIMGMWLPNELHRELGKGPDFDSLVRSAENSRYDGLVDANAPSFLAPRSMSEAMRQELQKGSYALPDSTADYFRCAYRSLAESYRRAILELEENTGKICERLYIVGGGAKNQFLNRLTQEATGKEVIALPIEATALGNLKIQMEADQ